MIFRKYGQLNGHSSSSCNSDYRQNTVWLFPTGHSVLISKQVNKTFLANSLQSSVGGESLARDHEQCRQVDTSVLVWLDIKPFLVAEDTIAHLNQLMYTFIHQNSRQYRDRLHPFNGPLSRTTRVSRYQKGKTNPDFTEARGSERQWHQLGHMQVCTSLQTDNQASTPTLSFLQVGCPSCRPTNSVKALKAIQRQTYKSRKQ